MDGVFEDIVNRDRVFVEWNVERKCFPKNFSRSKVWKSIGTQSTCPFWGRVRDDPLCCWDLVFSRICPRMYGLFGSPFQYPRFQVLVVCGVQLGIVNEGLNHGVGSFMGFPAISIA